MSLSPPPSSDGGGGNGSSGSDGSGQYQKLQQQYRVGDGDGSDGSGNDGGGGSGGQRHRHAPSTQPVANQYRPASSRRPARRSASYRRQQDHSAGLLSLHHSLTDIRGPRRTNRVDQVGNNTIHSSLTYGGARGGQRFIVPRRIGSNNDIASSMTSTARVRHNSISFRRGETSDLYIDPTESLSGGSGGESSVSVMDLRPHSQRRVSRRFSHGHGNSYNTGRDTELSSSLVSIGSFSSIGSDSIDRDRLNQSSLKMSARYIIAHDIGLNRMDSGGSSSSDRNDERSVKKVDEKMPNHWEAAPINKGSKDHVAHSYAPTQQETVEDVKDNSAVGTAFRRMSTKSVEAIASMIGIHKTNDDKSHDGLGSVSSNRYIGDADSIDMSLSDNDNGSDSSRTIKPSPPPTEGGEKKGQRQKIGTRYLRRCARAMVGFVVLAVLAGSVIIHLVPQEELPEALQFLLARTSLGRLLGHDSISYENAELSMAIPEEVQLQQEQEQFIDFASVTNQDFGRPV